jgi:hypothetical protein
MTHSADTARISPDERFREIAAILPATVVRLYERTALPPAIDLTNLPPKGLEVRITTVLSVLTG